MRSRTGRNFKINGESEFVKKKKKSQWILIRPTYTHLYLSILRHFSYSFVTFDDSYFVVTTLSEEWEYNRYLYSMQTKGFRCIVDDTNRYSIGRNITLRRIYATRRFNSTYVYTSTLRSLAWRYRSLKFTPVRLLEWYNSRSFFSFSNGWWSQRFCCSTYEKGK